jgi:hypothetical protein
VAGAISIWFSHPAVFVLAGIGSCLFWEHLFKKQWSQVLSMVTAILLWVLSFGIMYVMEWKLMANQTLLDYWASSFMPLPPKSMADIQWFDNTFLSLFQNPLGLFPSSLAALAFMGGCIIMAVKDRMKFALLTSPIFFALLVSALHKYPFNGRLLLFIMPSFLILIAAGVKALQNQQNHGSTISKAVASALIIPAFVYSSSILVKPLAKEEIKPVLEYVQTNWQSGDIVYVPALSVAAFVYYADKYGFKDGDYYLANMHFDDPQQYVNEIDALSGHRRIWLLFSHIWRGDKFEEDLYLVACLDAKRTKLGFFQATGASVHLYSQ